MTTAELPHKGSDALHLVEATSEENHAQTIVNSEEWRGPLSLDAYLRREAYLSTLELTKNGDLTAWMLVFQPDGQGARQVVCGCETYNKKALVGKSGTVEAVTCYGVASVFCAPKYRGRGYAGRMMAELGKRLETWQQNAERMCKFSVLFSDIGRDFYAARGWQPFPSTHIALPATVSPVPDGVKLLKSEDIPSLCSADEVLIRKRLAGMKDSGRTAVAVVPDHRTIAWHHAREDFVGQELRGATPTVRGAMVVLSPAQRIWCYWARVWTNPQEHAPNTLNILRLVVEDETYSEFDAASSERAAELQGSQVSMATAALFRAAQCQAAEWGMEEVCIWNPTSTTLAAAQSINKSIGVVNREKESIASLRWYGPGSWKDVDWICNEKYSWC